MEVSEVAPAMTSESSIEIANDDFHSMGISEDQLVMISKPSIRSCDSSKAKEDQEFYQSRASTTEFCRICHDLDTSEVFISPCHCKGSLSFVHKSCLERWLAESDSNRCELCGFNFTLTRFPKYSVLLSVIAWLTSSSTWRERRNLLVDLIVLLLISPVVCVTTLMAFQLMETVFSPEFYLPEGLEKQLPARFGDSKSTIVNADRRVSYQLMNGILYNLGRMGIMALIITIDLAYVSWITLKMQYHVSTWYCWYRRNCKVLSMVARKLSNLGRMGIAALIVTIDMAYVSWITVKMQYHVCNWYYWYRRNCKVTLTQTSRQPGNPSSSDSTAH